MSQLPAALLRPAFVASQAVTAEQWDRAADGSADGGAVLEALNRVPAWWAADGSARAVTAYQVKLVQSLAAAGSLASLARRLRWGNYLIRNELGRGGMGVVFHARDLAANEDVALKRVRGQARQDLQEARSRFRREGEILSRLDHPSIARFRGVERLDGVEVLVMEYVAGETVSRYVRRLAAEGRRVPWRAAVRWTLDILDALAHAHGRRVVHRDIKPGNVMLTGVGGGVKLLDMGLAKCAELTTGGCDLTHVGQILGTSEYMPPEQWTGGSAVTAAADLYALGGTLFFLLAGRSPFVGASTHQQMMQHLSAAVPSVRETRGDVPAALDAIIRRMLAKDPLHRGTARELKWQLDGLLSVASSPVVERVAAFDAGGATPGRHSATTRPPPSELAPVARPKGSNTVLAAEASTVVTPRVWPLIRDMGDEFKRLVGLGKRQRTSVFDDPPPLSRLCWLTVAVGLAVWAKRPRLRARVEA